MRQWSNEGVFEIKMTASELLYLGGLQLRVNNGHGAHAMFKELVTN